MPLEPIHTPMRFEVGVIEHPPEGRAAHRWSRWLVAACAHQVLHTPARRRAVPLPRLPGGKGNHIAPLPGGKSAVAVLTVAHPAVPRVPARDTGCATGAPYGDHKASRWQAGDATGAQARQRVGAADNGTPMLEA
jgi:hypothetical protein